MPYSLWQSPRIPDAQLPCHQQVWYDYACWHADNGRREAASKVYKRAMKALPDCLLLHFAYADFAEAGNNLVEVCDPYTEPWWDCCQSEGS